MSVADSVPRRIAVPAKDHAAQATAKSCRKARGWYARPARNAPATLSATDSM